MPEENIEVYDSLISMTHFYLKGLGYEEMEECVYRRDNHDIIIKIESTVHNDGLE